MHPNLSTHSTSQPGLRARRNPSLHGLTPFLFAVVAGLSSLAVHAGSCNFTSPGAATCVMPAGVTSVSVVGTGGGGSSGGANGGNGASGGIVAGVLSGVGGTSLSLFVGGGGFANSFAAFSLPSHVI